MIEVQRSAAHIVGHVRAGRSLNAELQNLFSSARALSAHDRATLQDTAFGTLRFLGEIDTVLDDLLKRPLESDRLRDLLADRALSADTYASGAARGGRSCGAQCKRARGSAREGTGERRIAGVLARSEQRARRRAPRRVRSLLASSVVDRQAARAVSPCTTKRFSTTPICTRRSRYASMHGGRR